MHPLSITLGFLLWAALLPAQTTAPCPAGDCNCLLLKADKAAENPATFSVALDRYFAVTACDENLRGTVEDRINQLLARIEQLRKNEEKARRIAADKEKKALEARALAEEESRKTLEVLYNIYFYQDEFGLAYEDGKYGFIDKDLNTRIGFEYKEALPFDETGFARVKKQEGSTVLNFLIDTLGKEYPVVYDVHQLDNTIVALDLRNLSLDSVPEAVFDHIPLKILLLNNNQLTSLPDKLGQLVNLEVLYLSFNQLTSLPENIGQLTHLKTLELVANFELTLLPEVFFQLTELTTLGLGSNGLTSLSENFGRLKKLEALDLSNSGIDRLPESFGQLTSLEDLNLGMTDLDSLPESFGQLSNLTHLVIFTTPLTGLPESFGQLSNLISLDLSANNLTRLPESFGQLSNLIYLDLSNNQLSNLPLGIQKLKSLETFVLYGNPLVDEDEITRLQADMPWCEMILSAEIDD